jgi:uncharacterized membrane protein
MHRVRFSQGLFAIASASLAIFSLAYGDFAPGGQSLPAWIPWRVLWVHVAALLVLAASVGLWFARTAQTSALTVGAYQAVWMMLSVPGIVSAPLSLGAWYPFCEAATALVGAWILYELLRWPPGQSQMPMAAHRAARAAQVVFGLTCIFYGCSHFAYADYTAGMVPAWLPDRLGLAYLTGLGHLAAGIAIVVGILAPLAGTLEALMMSAFGLLVWVPSFFAHPPPKWATPPQNQWSELVVTLALAAAAWIVAGSLRARSAAFAPGARM